MKLSEKRVRADLQKGEREGWDAVDLTDYPETFDYRWPTGVIEYWVNAPLRGCGLYPSEIAAYFTGLSDDSGFDDWPKVHIEIQAERVIDVDCDTLFIAGICGATYQNSRAIQFEVWSPEGFLRTYAAKHFDLA